MLFEHAEHSVVVYANSLEQAIEEYSEHLGEAAPSEGWEQIPIDSVAVSRELVGIGGFDEVYYENIISWMRIQKPYVFDDIEGLLSSLGD